MNTLVVSRPPKRKFAPPEPPPILTGEESRRIIACSIGRNVGVSFRGWSPKAQAIRQKMRKLRRIARLEREATGEAEW